MAIDDDEPTVHEPFEVFVRNIKGVKTCLNVIETNTVLEVKELLIEIMEDAIPVNQQRLIFAGHILRDDEVLRDLKIKDGSVLNLARIAPNSQRPSSPPASVLQVPRPVESDRLPNGMRADQVSSLMNNPVMSSLLENPEFMRTMLQADPRMQRLIEQNPEMRHMLQDPSFLRQTAQMMRNPRMLAELQRNQDRALANIENIPGGFQALSSLYNQLEPLHGPREDQNPSTDELNRQFAARLGVSEPSADRPNTDALPNPWAVNDTNRPVTNNPALQRAGPSHEQLATLTSRLRQLPNTSPNPQQMRSQWTTQLARMHELGFTDDDANLRALLAAGGDVDAAINYLIDNA